MQAYEQVEAIVMAVKNRCRENQLCVHEICDQLRISKPALNTSAEEVESST